MASDILVVDDEIDIRNLIAGILEDEGYEVRTAADSDEALAAIGARRPQLIFLVIWLFVEAQRAVKREIQLHG